jgi:cysteine desulfurase
VFTSGGTEADNLALRGPTVARRRLVISSVEHPAIELPADALADQGWIVDRLAVDTNGCIDLDAAAEILARPAGLVSVITAQNETGVLQPVGHICRAARRAASDVVVHTDAAQAVGKVPVNVSELGVDLLTVVSHKLYGPCGIGALFVRKGVALTGLFRGGGQERGIRPGTEPVMLVVGLGAACRLAASSLAQEGERQQALRERLWVRLSSGVPGIVRTGEAVPSLPNTLHVRFPGRDGAQILACAPAVAASTGSACHAHDGSVSGVLGAMGLTAAQARGAVRLSLGRHTTADEIERAAMALIEAFGRAGNPRT